MLTFILRDVIVLGAWPLLVYLQMLIPDVIVVLLTVKRNGSYLNQK